MGVADYDYTGNGAGNQYFGSDFHQLSQDLRNPLNSINGFAELLLMDQGLSPVHADYVRAILTGSEALTATVVSFLDRAETIAPIPAVMAGRKAHPEAEPAPRRSIFKQARRWGAPLRPRGATRSGTV